MKLNDINTDFRHILVAKAKGDWPTVNETSLARAHKHVSNGHFGILTSYRAGKTPAENQATFAELKHTVRAAGYGFITLLGHWQECQDPTIPYEEAPPDLIKDVVEPSLFVPNIDFELLTSLSGKYDQDAAVYCGKETDNQVYLVFKNGDKQSLGTFHPGRIARAYSKLPKHKNRTFVFEYVAQTHLETTILERSAKE